MKRGAIKVLIFYISGLALTGLTYFIFGAYRGHGPAPYIAIPFLICLTGIIWMGRMLWSYFIELDKTEEKKGKIYSNALALLILTAAIFYNRNQNGFAASQFSKPSQTREKKSGDSISLFYNDALIYLSVRDTVYVDKRDSILSP